MLYPTINQLTGGQFNRYELVIATAKCARMVTDEYVRQRETAEKAVAFPPPIYWRVRLFPVFLPSWERWPKRAEKSWTGPK